VAKAPAAGAARAGGDECAQAGRVLVYWFEEVVRPNLALVTYVNYELFVRLRTSGIIRPT
jgi:hypothetical protein